MSETFVRTQALIGVENVRQLHEKTVAVFGIGGVGGYVVEALVRSGVGNLVLVDHDVVNESNINRQIIATHDTIGRYKVDVMKERVLSICPDTKVECRNTFFLPENADEFNFSQYDYVVDAVDTVTAKLQIIMQAKAAGVPVISSMGAGNKLNPAAFEVADIYDTSVCPLAKVMRRECKKRGIRSLKVVYSKEPPVVPLFPTDTEVASGAVMNSESVGGVNTLCHSEASKTLNLGKRAPGSVAFVPSVVGMIIGGEVIKDLCNIGNSDH